MRTEEMINVQFIDGIIVISSWNSRCVKKYSAGKVTDLQAFFLKMATQQKNKINERA